MTRAPRPSSPTLRVLVAALTLGCGGESAPTASTPVETVGPAPDEAASPAAEAGGLAVSAYWQARAPYVRDLARGTWIEENESWSGSSSLDEPLVSVRVRTRSEDREADLAAAERFLLERSDRVGYSLSRTAMSGGIDGLTVSARTPGFFEGELWIEATGTGTREALRAACTGDPWAEELASIADWRDRVVGCGTWHPAEGPIRSSIRLDVDTEMALALRAAGGFELPESCALATCWRRAGERPAALRIADAGGVDLTLNPEAAEEGDPGAPAAEAR